ncbi:B-box zinc finger protein 21-like isoform X1 [Cucurbita moschata]|uniref:B-box zinc finger protein 21-like isoform X1 n=1 Tax=Cucurbita moschata TaxID=3662 RepID=A0A6J1FN66_CUCMO|nr:B-box zinc finger protein 21-like isoform X1 [Cucurbita moschata]
MKIQCDVCNKDEALLFCTADDAALCSTCDHRVHHANVLASKHLRFPLLHPNNNNFPLCDICQERRAFLFCQQDRAILCKDCDFPIHSVNELTQKHDRFLLTGVKLSCESAGNVPSSSSMSEKMANASSAPVSNSPSIAESSTSNAQTVGASTDGCEAMNGVEYFIDAISGWHFDDFLDSSSTDAPPFGFCKLQSDEVDGDWVFQFVDDLVELETSGDSFSSEDWGIRSPEEEAAVPLFCSEIEMEERKKGRTLKEKTRGGGGGGGGDGGISVPEVDLRPRRFRSS